MKYLNYLIIELIFAYIKLVNWAKLMKIVQILILCKIC